MNNNVKLSSCPNNKESILIGVSIIPVLCCYTVKCQMCMNDSIYITGFIYFNPSKHV